MTALVWVNLKVSYLAAFYDVSVSGSALVVGSFIAETSKMTATIMVIVKVYIKYRGSLQLMST